MTNESVGATPETPPPPFSVPFFFLLSEHSGRIFRHNEIAKRASEHRRGEKGGILFFNGRYLLPHWNSRGERARARRIPYDLTCSFIFHLVLLILHGCVTADNRHTCSPPPQLKKLVLPTPGGTAISSGGY